MAKSKKNSRSMTPKFLIVVLVACLAIGCVVYFATRPQDAVGGAIVTATPGPTPTPAPANPASAAKATANASHADEEGDVSQPLDESEQVVVADSDLSVYPGLDANWHNILLLGQDTRSSLYNGRSDTMIICSINKSTGASRLCSIMRDTFVNIPGVGENRLNTAHYYGGPNLAMKAINEAFNMNITEYMSVNFAMFPFIIDDIGGIEINVAQDEVSYINAGVGNSIWEGKINNLDETKLDDSFLPETSYGPNTLLTGRQALAYARIRKLDSDYKRTARQRVVINAVLQKVMATTSDPIQLTQMATRLIPYVKTDLNLNTLVALALPVVQGGSLDMAELRMPIDGSFVEESRNFMEALYDVNLETNRAALHEFIYG